MNVNAEKSRTFSTESDNTRAGKSHYSSKESENTIAEKSQSTSTEKRHGRKWRNTTLGDKYEFGEYPKRSADTILSIMSYNVLADRLAAMHPELYTHCKIQGLYSNF